MARECRAPGEMSASEKALAAACARFYAKKRGLGICTWCGKSPARPGKAHCQGCADEKNAAARAKRIARKRERYDHAVATGICGRCLSKPATRGIECQDCRDARTGKRAPLRTMHCDNCGAAGHFAITCRAPVFARCRCGLRLFAADEQAAGSCGSCLPTAAEAGSNRREWA